MCQAASLEKQVALLKSQLADVRAARDTAAQDSARAVQTANAAAAAAKDHAEGLAAQLEDAQRKQRTEAAHHQEELADLRRALEKERAERASAAELRRSSELEDTSRTRVLEAEVSSLRTQHDRTRADLERVTQPESGVVAMSSASLAAPRLAWR